MSIPAGKQHKAVTTRTTDVSGANAAVLRRPLSGNDAERLCRTAQSLQRKSAPSTSIVQPSLRVSSGHEPAEREADATARTVLRMTAQPSRPLPVSQTPPRAAARIPTATPKGVGSTLAAVQPKGVGAPALAPEVAAEIEKCGEGGAPLPGEVRRFMEPRFGADFSGVRICTGDRAAALNRQLGSRAFTVGHRIFFGRGSFAPETAEGRDLLAHELTHTIQQGAVVQRREEGAVATRAPTMVQRLGIGDAVGFLAEKAYLIPGFRFLAMAVGFNPINRAPVQRSGANLLRAMVELVPGGALMLQAVENGGVLERAGNWVEEQVATVRDAGTAIKGSLDRFLDSLSWKDIFRPEEVWTRAKSVISRGMERISSFARGLTSALAEMVKSAILLPLARFAEKTRGYDLLKGVLGRDPITGEAVEPTPETLIAGFLQLIGQDEVWENIKKSNAIAKTWGWFKGAVKALAAFVRAVPDLFKKALAALEWIDLVLIPRAFAKVGGVFAGLVGSFVEWGSQAVWNLLEIIFEVLAPDALPHLKKAREAFRGILRDPVGFVRNLTNAGILGFNNFAANIGTHLRTALIEWLTGSLPGVYIPKALEFAEILKFVQSVLGLTWDNLRHKIAKLVGEPVMRRLETGFEVVTRLVVEGPAAAWRQIVEVVGNLKEMVIGAITDFVTKTVVKKAVADIVAMLIPGASFVKAVISIYDTMMVFVDKLQRIKEVVATLLGSIMEIAGGAIGSAAKKVESTLAGVLVLAVNFLAGFAGLGKVAVEVNRIINEKIRGPIENALGMVADWVVKSARRIGLLVKEAGQKVIGWWKRHTPFSTAQGARHDLFWKGSEEKPIPWVASDEPAELAACLARWQGMADGNEASAAMRKAKGTLKRAAALEQQLRQVDGKKQEPEKLQKELTPHLAELLDIFEPCVEKGDAVLACDITKVPVLTYRTRNLRLGSRDAMVGYHMTCEYLAPNHGQGTKPGESEQAQLFEALPTLGKVGSGKTGAETYIKGHLLNENLGGPGVAKNMFPITTQANSDHKNRIEFDAKDLVNTRGCLVFYEVKVDPGEVKAVDGLKTEKGEAIYSLNAKFICCLDTYVIKKKKMERRKAPKEITIESVYKAKPLPGPEKSEKQKQRQQLDKDLELLARQSVKMTDFDKEKVKLAAGKKKRSDQS